MPKGHKIETLRVAGGTDSKAVIHTSAGTSENVFPM